MITAVLNDYYNGSYPKMKSWKADSDCCSWDGVTCDPENGHVVGLNLTNSWLNGRLNSNSSLFSLRHLHRLNLALNNFTSSTIPSQFGHLGNCPVQSATSSQFFLNWGIAQFNRQPQVLELFGSSRQPQGELPSIGKVLEFNFFWGIAFNRGKIPRSLVQCRMLEVLNLGNNKLNDTFPFWLESLPELQILVLRANGFHGPIWDPATKIGFSKLHVIDLSHNNFTGELPSKYFMTLECNANGPPSKILTIFTAIDLSNNRFYGEIPDSVGNLNGLIVLNLSNNSFASHIPSSFGNLTALESLDLSQNLLSGEIPQQLTSLTFLEYLNLSQNHLTGPIPQGGQFSTFQNSSFEGNLGLCGSPLSNKCENNETPTSIPSRDSSFGEGFTWKVVVIGYACGLVIGFLIGHVVISRRPDWFMRTFRVKLHR
uniref:Leucine-rich repeat-containing N-terminal plant-type domain-containing protein n=1 Tax=Fagus sylvatica TaxID=28930 RepID=A0A2N9H7B0_FAGSY